MPSRPEPTLLDLLYRAVNSPHGIIVETSNLPVLRQKLYALKKEYPDLANLILKPHPIESDSKLYIIRKPVDAKSTDSETHPTSEGG